MFNNEHEWARTKHKVRTNFYRRGDILHGSIERKIEWSVFTRVTSIYANLLKQKEAFT